jgi:UDP-N-acetyl-2-amino-2-deoxyglucuronate dehydrogenase
MTVLLCLLILKTLKVQSLLYENVIKTLRGEAEAETDGREGLRSLELLIAAYLSARDGRTVPLPLEY